MLPTHNKKLFEKKKTIAPAQTKIRRLSYGIKKIMPPPSYHPVKLSFFCYQVAGCGKNKKNTGSLNWTELILCYCPLLSCVNVLVTYSLTYLYPGL